MAVSSQGGAQSAGSQQMNSSIGHIDSPLCITRTNPTAAGTRILKSRVYGFLWLVSKPAATTANYFSAGVMTMLRKATRPFSPPCR